MDLRQAQLQDWVIAHWPQVLDRRSLELRPVAGDASFRRYFRAQVGAASYIAVDAPPDKENSRPFVEIAQRWHGFGIRVPEVLSVDFDQGFLLLEDFGDAQLLPWLQAGSDRQPYEHSLQTLLSIQTMPAEQLPAYDSAVLMREMELYPQWFLAGLLNQAPDLYQDLLAQTYQQLISSALAQPQVCVHRDYHSRNLMPLADGGLGVIDFQDALIGPLTYDLVSLLRDSYIDWSDTQVESWVEAYRQKLLGAGFDLPDTRQFQKWFDLMGMQRQLKVVGIFARLWLRDGKSGYLKDIPRTFHYLLRAARRYPEFSALSAHLETLLPVMEQHPLLAEHMPTADNRGVQALEVLG